MAKTLDEQLHALAAKGELNYLSIAFLSSGVYSASYRGASEGHFGHGNNADPVKAIADAVANGKKPVDKTPKKNFDFG